MDWLNFTLSFSPEKLCKFLYCTEIAYSEFTHEYGHMKRGVSVSCQNSGCGDSMGVVAMDRGGGATVPLMDGPPPMPKHFEIPAHN